MWQGHSMARRTSSSGNRCSGEQGLRRGATLTVSPTTPLRATFWSPTNVQTISHHVQTISHHIHTRMGQKEGREKGEREDGRGDRWGQVGTTWVCGVCWLGEVRMLDGWSLRRVQLTMSDVCGRVCVGVWAWSCMHWWWWLGEQTLQIRHSHGNTTHLSLRLQWKRMRMWRG